MKKKIKAYIEIYTKSKDWYPTIMMKKPLKREIKNSREFGYEIYDCIINIGKKI